MKMDQDSADSDTVMSEQFHVVGDSPETNSSDTSTSTLTLRVIMQGKEAGSVIGKKGDNVKRFREESGAKINISDASCPERIVTVTGTTDQIYKAFTMICTKFEEDVQMSQEKGSVARPPVTLRLVVPASQCGSLIGKGGSKIKEIREVTGAWIQVASEMLPNSTERSVTVSGSADATTQCMYHICRVMLESPPKGTTIPYRPKPALPPVLYAGGQPYTIQSPHWVHPDPRNMVQLTPAGPAISHPQQQQLAKMGVDLSLMGRHVPMLGGPMMAGLPGGVTLAPSGYPHMHHPSPQQHPATQPQQLHQQQQQHQQPVEITIPNDLIGCIIGRGGSKINEIRQLSGAAIKIGNIEEGSADRRVTITGSPDTINAAQYLINASIELHKHQLMLDPTAAVSLGTSPGVQTLPHLAIPDGRHPPLCKAFPLLGMAGAANINISPHKTMTTKIKGATALIPTSMATATAGNKFAPY